MISQAIIIQDQHVLMVNNMLKEEISFGTIPREG